MRVDRKAMRDAGDAKCANDRLGGEAAVEVEGPLEGGLAGGSARQGLPSAAHATISSPVALEYLLPGTKSPFPR